MKTVLCLVNGDNKNLKRVDKMVLLVRRDITSHQSTKKTKFPCYRIHI